MANDTTKVELVQGPDATRSVGKWTRRLMERELDGDGALGSALGTRVEQQWPGFVRELFGELYGLGTKELAAEDKRKGSGWIDEVLEQAQQLPEWRELQARSEGDPWRCGLGTRSAVEALESALGDALDQLPEDPQEMQDQADEAQQELEEYTEGMTLDAGGHPDPGQEAVANDLATEQVAAQTAADEAAEAAEQVRQEIKAGDGVKLRQALREAADEAHGELDEMEEALAGLGHGTGAGALTGVKAPTEQVAKALRANPELRRIAAIAGRIRLSAKREQASKCEHGREEICDVETGSDIPRLLPSELMMMADPILEPLLLLKIVESQALQYKMSGTEKAEKGPIVLLVDGSASMAGARHEWAMGVSLAMMEVAAMQNRSFALAHFGSSIMKHDVVANPRTMTLDQLVDMVCYFANSGTNIRNSVDWVKDTLIPQTGCLKGADLLLITDGQCCTGDFSQALRDLREEHGAATFGIAIQVGWMECNRAELADYHEVTDQQIRGGTEDIGGTLAL